MQQVFLLVFALMIGLNSQAADFDHDPFTAFRLSVDIVKGTKDFSDWEKASGFLLSDHQKTYLITAKHAVDFVLDDEVIRISDPIDSVLPSSSFKLGHQLFDPYLSRDLFIVELPNDVPRTNLHVFSSIRQSDLKPGDTIYIDGYSAGNYPTRLKCHFDGLTLRPAEPSESSYSYRGFVLSGAATCDVIASGFFTLIQGMSGGPVFDDQHQLVGIFSSVESEEDNNAQWDSHVTFTPIFQNTVSDFAKEFCGKNYHIKQDPNEKYLQFDNFCKGSYPVFKPKELAYEQLPYASQHALDVNPQLQGTMPYFSFCRKTDLSTVRILQQTNGHYAVVSSRSESTDPGQVGEFYLGYFSNFDADRSTVAVQDFADLASALNSFRKSCQN